MVLSCAAPRCARVLRAALAIGPTGNEEPAVSASWRRVLDREGTLGNLVVSMRSTVRPSPTRKRGHGFSVCYTQSIGRVARHISQNSARSPSDSGSERAKPRPYSQGHQFYRHLSFQ
jgi:hypothetical protein